MESFSHTLTVRELKYWVNELKKIFPESTIHIGMAVWDYTGIGEGSELFYEIWNSYFMTWERYPNFTEVIWRIKELRTKKSLFQKF